LKNEFTISGGQVNVLHLSIVWLTKTFGKNVACSQFQAIKPSTLIRVFFYQHDRYHQHRSLSNHLLIVLKQGSPPQICIS